MKLGVIGCLLNVLSKTSDRSSSFNWWLISASKVEVLRRMLGKRKASGWVALMWSGGWLLNVRVSRSPARLMNLMSASKVSGNAPDAGKGISGAEKGMRCGKV